VQDIKACVEKQLDLATYGVAKSVSDLQTKTGVKDKIAQYWIEILIEKARDMATKNPTKPAAEISKELHEWLKSQTKRPYNALLDMPRELLLNLDQMRLIEGVDLDVSQDTLVEILHTILLGVEKYAWYDLHSQWNGQQQELFAIRLQGTNIDGLLVPPIRAAYIMQYRNGLIGKHFKTLIRQV
jgi:hypothetical protein